MNNRRADETVFHTINQMNSSVSALLPVADAHSREIIKHWAQDRGVVGSNPSRFGQQPLAVSYKQTFSLNANTGFCTMFTLTPTLRSHITKLFPYISRTQQRTLRRSRSVFSERSVQCLERVNKRSDWPATSSLMHMTHHVVFGFS